MAGFVRDRAPCVPDHQLVVVPDTAEQGLVQQVPGYVLHHRGVSGEDRLCVDDLVLLANFFCL